MSGITKSKSIYLATLLRMYNDSIVVRFAGDGKVVLIDEKGIESSEWYVNFPQSVLDAFHIPVNPNDGQPMAMEGVLYKVAMKGEKFEREYTVTALSSTIPEKEAIKLDTTECDKMLAAQEKSQAIRDFLEWLLSGKADDTRFNRPLFLATYGIKTGYYNIKTQEFEDIPEKERQVGDKIYMYTYVTEKLLAKYFDIDLAKVDKERRGMLNQLPG